MGRLWYSVRHKVRRQKNQIDFLRLCQLSRIGQGLLPRGVVACPIMPSACSVSVFRSHYEVFRPKLRFNTFNDCKSTPLHEMKAGYGGIYKRNFSGHVGPNGFLLTSFHCSL